MQERTQVRTAATRGVRLASGTATTVLALGLAIGVHEGAPAQQSAFSRPTTARPPTSLDDLQGSWIRNGPLSEDPIRKTRQTARERNWESPVIEERAQLVARRLETLSIRVVDDAVVLLDAQGDERAFPLDAEARGLRGDLDSRASVVDGTLTIETLAPDWLGVETFHRERHQLIRTTRLRSRGYGRVWFRTVYERPRTAAQAVSPLVDRKGSAGQPAVIRIVPPERGYRERLSGRVEIQTLVIDPLIVAVEFFLDGERVKRSRRPPFTNHIELAHPPREQTLEVRAYDPLGEYAGSDTMVLNRIEGPFAVRVTRIGGVQTDGRDAVRVEAAVSVPRSATLERVEFYRSEHLVRTIDWLHAAAEAGAPRTVPISAMIEDARPDDFVRVTARLADGRDREDAELLVSGEHHGEIDVQLVQLQVLVTDRGGNPVSGLRPEDFEIRQNGRRLAAEDLHTARDVPLVLGLAIDSSASMEPVWRHLRYVAGTFIAASLMPGDRAFLVDFDDTVRLLQPLGANKRLLSRRLEQLVPAGGTALNDGLLFSLLQYRGEPGRRALVVVTDGIDLISRSRPEQSADFAERLGLPIYFIELDNQVQAEIQGGGLARRMSDATLHREKARRRLRRISQQTGGRLFHIELSGGVVPWTERIEHVFDRIENDLRHQHVLTWYSDLPIGTAIEPDVRVRRRGLKLRSAVPLEAIE